MKSENPSQDAKYKYLQSDTLILEPIDIIGLENFKIAQQIELDQDVAGRVLTDASETVKSDSKFHLLVKTLFESVNLAFMSDDLMLAPTFMDLLDSDSKVMNLHNSQKCDVKSIFIEKYKIHIYINIYQSGSLSLVF